MFTTNTNVDDICDVNLRSSICSNLPLKQDMDVIDKSRKFTPSSSPFKTISKFWFLIIKAIYVKFKLKIFYVIYTIS